ncbi:hypothetical protein V5R04_09400 [Jonesiaceae bacterium BS-20]|uniref:Uncharacterized protein n=1 Tax=Jonesiaceae bacterium BS-20 TaxID=3120821 RepID=A0AAU7DUL6_9MICO
MTQDTRSKPSWLRTLMTTFRKAAPSSSSNHKWFEPTESHPIEWHAYSEKWAAVLGQNGATTILAWDGETGGEVARTFNHDIANQIVAVHNTVASWCPAGPASGAPDLTPPLDNWDLHLVTSDGFLAPSPPAHVARHQGTTRVECISPVYLEAIEAYRAAVETAVNVPS